MKYRSIKYLASLLVISTCCVGSLSAQEGGFMYHEGGGDYQEKPEAPSSPGGESSYTQPGLKSNYNVQSDAQQEPTTHNNVTKEAGKTDPVPTRPATTAPVKSENREKEENTDDSVLSYNFLHYIIQRFKFADIIDQ